jgi:hypothetical protein
VSFACNLSEYSRIRLKRATGETECSTCTFPHGSAPPGCADTIPSFNWGCDYPLEAPAIEGSADGVRLSWRIAADFPVDGYDIERRTREATTRLTAYPLPPCGTCEYLDAAPPREAASYTVVIHTGSGRDIAALLGSYDPAPPRGPVLEAPAPHPVRGSADLRFRIPEPMRVRLELLDLLGRRIDVIRDEVLPAGLHVLRWEAQNKRGRPLASGLYLLRLATPEGSVSRKVFVLP